MLRLLAVGDSRVGLVRKINQDSAFLGPACILVADGVGGGAAGEVASASAAHAVARTVTLRPGHDPVAVLGQAVARAQSAIAAGTESDPERAGMATTLTVVITDGRRVVMAHLGDSRGYVYRNGELIQVTRDHTYVQDLVEEGRLAARSVADHPWRNVVLRTVNGHPANEADIVELHLDAGDRLLLASDGLTDLVPPAELAEVLSARSDEEALAHLTSTALARGGHDNITALIATVVDGPPVNHRDGHFLGAAADPANVVKQKAVRAPSA